MTSSSTTHLLLKPGDVLNGRWEIKKHIASGGKGEVYLARQLRLEREVAVKIISQELMEALGDDQEEIDAEMERFRREVLAMASLRHPNVLQVYDFEHADLPRPAGALPIDYLVMEYIPGPTLASTIPPDGLASDEQALKGWIRSHFLPVLEGVDFIHQHKIIHRDLKPSNVLLDEQIPKIADFGLVGGGPWQQVTRSHHVIGTLAYMAPEQYLDLAETDYRADVYSLGKMLYNAAVGKLGKETMLPLQAAKLPRADTPFLAALDKVIQEATAQERDQRIGSVAELKARLENLVGAAKPRPASKRAVWWAAGVAAALAAALAWGLWYHFNMPELQQQGPPSPHIAQAPAPTASSPPPTSISSPAGAVLRLVPNGRVSIREQEVEVKPFYLAEARVTNHEYVEFLNSMRDELTVEQGVVKRDGEPWLRLGELRKGVRPISHQGGRFRITDPKYASHPVLLVSGHGAQSFVRHYGLRLPTEAELLRAGWSAERDLAGDATPRLDEEGMAAMHAQMSQTSPAESVEQGYWPVTHWAPNAFGLRGLGEAGLGEWALAGPDGAGPTILGAPEGPNGAPRQGPRMWEAFTWVGFRSARDLAPPRR